jgi:hypothetical protein
MNKGPTQQLGGCPAQSSSEREGEREKHIAIGRDFISLDEHE